MSVLERLATALDRNDERPNVELAEQIAESGDKDAIAELTGAVANGKRPIQNDAIKVLSELAERRPELLADHHEAFLTALHSPNRRLVWGAMAALAGIAPLRAGEIYERMPEIMEGAGRSVIARDNAVRILVALADAGHQRKSIAGLLEILRTAPHNQFATYAERSAHLMGRGEADEFRAILLSQLEKTSQPAKRRRIEKILRNFQ